MLIGMQETDISCTTIGRINSYKYLGENNDYMQ